MMFLYSSVRYYPVFVTKPIILETFIARRVSPFLVGALIDSAAADNLSRRC